MKEKPQKRLKIFTETQQTLEDFKMLEQERHCTARQDTSAEGR